MQDFNPIGQSDQSSLNSNEDKNPKNKKWGIIIGALVVVLGIGAYLFIGTDLFKGFIGIETGDLNKCLEYSADEIYAGSKVDFTVKKDCAVEFAVDEGYGELAVREQNDDTAEDNVVGSEKEVAEEKEVAATESEIENHSYITGLKATALDSAVHLEWSEEDDTGVKGYTIYYGLTSVTAPGQEYDSNIDVGDVLEYTMTGLENGTTYYFSVVAYDEDGNENLIWAPEASATPSAAPQEAAPEAETKTQTSITIEADTEEEVSPEAELAALEVELTAQEARLVIAETAYSNAQTTAEAARAEANDAQATAATTTDGNDIATAEQAEAEASEAEAEASEAEAELATLTAKIQSLRTRIEELQTQISSQGQVSVFHTTLDGISDLINPMTATEGQIVTLTALKAGINVFHVRFNGQQWDLDILEKVEGEEDVEEEEEEVTVDSILAAMEKDGDVCALAKQPEVDVKVVSAGYNSFVTLNEYVIKAGESVEVEDPTENGDGYLMYKNPSQGTLEVEEGSLSYAANEDYEGEDSVILVQSSVEPETRFDLQIIVDGGYKESVVEVLEQRGMTITQGEDEIADEGTKGVKIGTILGVLYIEDINLEDIEALSSSVRELITGKINEDIIVGIDGIEVQIPAVEASILEEFDGDLKNVEHINLYCFSEAVPAADDDDDDTDDDDDDVDDDDDDVAIITTRTTPTDTQPTVIAPPSGGGGGGGSSLIRRRKAADQPDIKVKSEELSVAKITDILDCLKENANPTEFKDTDDKAVEFISSIKYGSESIVKGYVEDGETVYEGDEKATRAEILKVMMISSCTPYNVQFEEDIKFKDVSDEDWFNNFVHSAREQNIVEGFEGNVYKPNNYTTRAEALKMLAVMGGDQIEKAPKSYKLKIADVDKNHWAYDVIKDAEYNNIIVGKQVGLQTLFFPDKEITRYEMATLIYNFYNALLEKN